MDLTGLYEVSQAAARVMRRQKAGPHHQHRVGGGPGSLAATMRVRGRQGRRGQSDQGHGPESARYGILVNAIAPGSILTEGTKQLFYGPDGQFKDSVQKMSPTFRWAGPGTPTKSPWRSCSWPIPKTPIPTDTS